MPIADARNMLRVYRLHATDTTMPHDIT